ncbi:NAD-dependent epimerase/dehydratase family protein [Amycolatopsis saalfeldensis]|uniref:Nucleoside-diphosphate-sugar epimerase n=1 Tax=Amycolatopsis saalfeldensis TaxID=394193 RepID=A0A1H8QDD8_9PSEU|nr:NAD-dependent epimerase/dehydratase family protein [Amycolatopsis saalfeldensis]SEO52232.1 Nucleoside-diphosphate-sugar epimerase [Amycolatopsis saalfeldensis]
MPQRVLVTGGTGFVAGHVIQELLDHGYRVRATVRTAAAALPAPVETARADLGSDEGWAEAVAGCDYVLHVASPFPAALPDDEQELIRPAVEGTLRVLRAAAAGGTVKRVVLTSSCAAVVAGHDRRDLAARVYTEADWSVVDASPPYQKSKTLAERAAWDFVAELPAAQRFELVAVNPGLVLGPLGRASAGTSVDVVRRLLARDVPGSARMAMAIVDVRDLAAAHRLAMETPSAAGNRYILAGEDMWMRDAARVLAAEFAGRGFRVPTGVMPNWVLWLAARFDRSLRLALYFLDRRERVSAAKAQRELGWVMRPARETLVDTGNSLIERGIVTPRGARAVPSAEPAGGR